jgi:hypothetical protein
VVVQLLAHTYSGSSELETTYIEAPRSELLMNGTPSEKKKTPELSRSSKRPTENTREEMVGTA